MSDETNPYAGIFAACSGPWTGKGEPFSIEQLRAAERRMAEFESAVPCAGLILLGPEHAAAILAGESPCPICGRTAPHVNGEHPW